MLPMVQEESRREDFVDGGMAADFSYQEAWRDMNAKCSAHRLYSMKTGYRVVFGAKML
jgi:hypothetical protein